jgi:hypothetical protein
MIAHGIVLGVCLIAAAAPDGATPRTAGERITLRDGQVVLGLVTSITPGPRGSVEFLVRRAWAQTNIKNHLERWENISARTAKLAVSERQKRLASWRRERALGAAADDQIIAWIDQELARLSAPGGPGPSTLLSVHLPRHEFRDLERHPATVERLLRLAWLCGLPEPESMPLDDLKDALEARGYAAVAVSKNPPAPLDRLLPPGLEPEPFWLARRAATEVSVDTDLRFIRFQDTLIPDTGGGQPLNGLGLSTALSELKRLLELDQPQPADPVVAKLKDVAARGKIGAVVTRLEIQPDLRAVSVESTLWVRIAPQRWVAYGSRAASVRPDDLGADAGKNLGDDPQVKGAFQIVEMLGLGSIPPDVKQRSLRIGAATEKALGMARSAFNQELNTLALPVLEPARDEPAPPRRKP